MRFSRKDLVLPLHLAEGAFLEVLLSQFRLGRKANDNGVVLEIEFNDATPATWNRTGREAVRGKVLKFDQKAARYQEDLDRILLHDPSGTFHHSDPGFPFRWASAGALPILNIGQDEYYCLFYRDVFPIGWNIANGATDTSAELLDPLQTLEREVGEELVIIDPEGKKRYVLRPDKDTLLDRPEFAVFRQLWCEQYPKLDISKFQPAQLPLRWERGPDKVNVRAEVHTKVLNRELTGCFVNINARDFGIEVDKIARMTVNDRLVLCDGEVTAHRALNRPVGLFAVRRVQDQIREGRTNFIPDRFFHGGKRYRGKEIEAFLRKTLLPEIRTWRSKRDVDLFEKATSAERLRLCPVTGSIIRRHMRLGPGDQIAPRISSDYDVFLSHAAPDQAFARKIYDALKDRKRRVYFAPASQEPGTWSRPIHTALESACVFIGVGSRVEYFDRPWPKYEADAFHMTHLTEPSARIIPFVKGINPNSLPLPLRGYEVIDYRQMGFRGAVEKLLRMIPRTCK
jgi:hypothetical protein